MIHSPTDFRHNRRRFLSSLAGGIAGVRLVSTSGFAQPEQPSPVQRKNVSTLNSASSDIVALKKAIARMKALPTGDLRHWTNQSDIHGKLGGDFNRCQHGNWWFLPWH